MRLIMLLAIFVLLGAPALASSESQGVFTDPRGDPNVSPNPHVALPDPVVDIVHVSYYEATLAEGVVDVIAIRVDNMSRPIAGGGSYIWGFNFRTDLHDGVSVAAVRWSDGFTIGEYVCGDGSETTCDASVSPDIDPATNTVQFKIPVSVVGRGIRMPTAYTAADYPSLPLPSPDAYIGDDAPNVGTGPDYSP